MRRVRRRWLLVPAIAIGNVASVPDAIAQYAPTVAPACDCGPSALPKYRVPYPQPAYRPLDGSSRLGPTASGMSGVSYVAARGHQVQARTNLGSSASDPIVGPALWQGVYAGVHGGYGAATATLGAPLRADIDLRGAFAGVHLGHNWQVRSWVVGLEGDVAKSWADGHSAAGTMISAERDWTASLRGRAGYAFGNTLAYVTGGVAFAGQTITSVQGGQSSRATERSAGYVYGGGLEWQVKPQVSLRGEVLRYEFTQRTITLNGVNVPLKMDETVVRAGVSFSFN
jgi:outer membrane immunogenic protein